MTLDASVAMATTNVIVLDLATVILGDCLARGGSSNSLLPLLDSSSRRRAFKGRLWLFLVVSSGNGDDKSDVRPSYPATKLVHATAANHPSMQ